MNNWTSTDGDILLVPGLPDLMLACGDELLWVCASGLFIHGPNGLIIKAAGGLAGVAYDTNTWALLMTSPSGFTVLTSKRDGTETSVILPSTVLSAHIGVNWTVLDHGIERSVVQTSCGTVVPVPVGAQDARPQPWLTGAGLIWCDGDRLYRLRDGEKVRSAGTLGARPKRWAAGPHGAAVFELTDGFMGMSPSGAPLALPVFDFETLRFSADGNTVLCLGEDGLMALNLNTGGIIAARAVFHMPIGYGPKALVLDEDTGQVQSFEGIPAAEGFLPCGTAVHQDTLYGPGGTAWDIPSGLRIWDTSPLSAPHLLAHKDGVISVGERIHGFDLQGNCTHDWPLFLSEELDGEIVDLHWVDGQLVIEVEQGFVKIGHNGKRLGSQAPVQTPQPPVSACKPWVFSEETGLVSWGEHCWPIAFDGLAITESGDALAWSEDGILMLLETPTKG